MTSFMIKAHENRPLHPSWNEDADCAFCRILRGELPASRVFENDKVIAILDIMPLRRGHTLVIPKVHIPKLSDLPPELAAAVGEAVSKVAHALTKALENSGLNVVCNQEYAQAVPHVHFHIIPAPKFGTSHGVDSTNEAVGGKAPLTHREMFAKEGQARGELDSEEAEILLTRIRARWTLFDKLYVYRGVVYIVTDHPSSIPDVRFIYSKAVDIKPGAEAEAERLPTDEDIKVISTKAAKSFLERRVLRVSTVFRITHYYHWSAELWYGFWRTYSSLEPSISEQGSTTLPPAGRIFFNHLDNHHWRDYASMNQWVLRSSFPSVTMEFIDDWRDRIEMGRPFVFERVVVADRSAAMLSFNYARYQRTAAAAFALPGSMSWWQPIRNNIVGFAGLDPAVGSGTSKTPVITYISRQNWGRRMLIPEHHEKLVQELYRLRDEYGYEVNVVEAENMSRLEQIRLAARTTILMGVHGNGLTSLLWMNPNPRSTVMEFFFPKGFAHDYEYTTRALGMVHYGFWNSEYFTSPGLPTPQYVEGFQGNEIPIDGEAVARLCVYRLSLDEEVDD
ncbi:hypothetical protein CPB84DRAFT_1744094 [Gymnopilus junonius]|uniref:HIT domain-containing protein n=1 Tax=Gymnopilus junonius TaxID=109634 RepID=A0A9P5NXV6_GYMJU|nr:hypothetical protein CPB84DRAFT_1744094 [Gymnopilus junonius]